MSVPSDVDHQALLAAARRFGDAGFSVVPARANGTKAPYAAPPDYKWDRWQHERAGPDQLGRWFTGGQFDGFGLACGAVSGHLEMFEFEGAAVRDGTYDGFTDAVRARGAGELLDRIERGYSEATPSGGVHLLYRLTDGPAAIRKLAHRPATAAELAADPDETLKLLIETKGEGGYVITAPSGGRTHPNGGAWYMLNGGPHKVATITAAERAVLYEEAARFDRTPAKMAYQRRSPRSPSASRGSRPGDLWAAATSWADVLVPHGWVYVGRTRGYDAWRRPGKTSGSISATTSEYDDGIGNLFVFSTSTEFLPLIPISKIDVWRMLNNIGTFEEAINEIRRLGFGPPPVPAHTPNGHGPAPLVVAERASSVPEDDDEMREFFNCRLAHRHILEMAKARRAGPYATFGEVMAEACARIQPGWRLPALIGGPGSCNLLIASVGPSGMGKGAAREAGYAAFDWGPAQVERIPLGSGEGLARSFGIGRKDRATGRMTVERTLYSAIITIPEIDTFAAMSARNGATISPQLRQLYSGEALGFGYSDPEKRVIIPQHAYRGIVIAGVQPGRGDILLAGDETGLPQRWLWLPTGDGDPPDVKPPDPPQIAWQPPDALKGVAVDDLRPRIVAVCAEAVEEIDESRRDQLRAGSTQFGSHALFTRLKAALVIAVIDMRIEVRADDWQLAGHLMKVSDRTRGHVDTARQQRNTERVEAQGHAEAHKDEIRRRKLEDHEMRRVARNIARRLPKLLGADGWVPRSGLRKKMTSRDRCYFDHAIDWLIKENRIEVTVGDNGRGKEAEKFRPAK